MNWTAKVQKHTKMKVIYSNGSSKVQDHTCPGFPNQVDHSLTIAWPHTNHTTFSTWFCYDQVENHIGLRLWSAWNHTHVWPRLWSASSREWSVLWLVFYHIWIRERLAWNHEWTILCLSWNHKRPLFGMEINVIKTRLSDMIMSWRWHPQP